MLINIFFAEGIENQQQGFGQRLSIINPFVTMRAPFIPTALSFTVGIVISGIKPNTSYNLNLELKHKDNQNIVFSQFIENFGVPDENMDNLTMNFDLKNVPFAAEGEYECLFSIGDVTKQETLLILKSKD